MLALGLALPGASCALRARPDPTRFYVLTPSAVDHAPALDPLTVGLGPITMPGYLQHPGLATRVGTEIRYAELDRWAEPLPTLFGRTLGQDLSALLGASIVAHPWYRSTPLDMVVRIDVRAFEVDAAGDARLDACWTVRKALTNVECREECSSIVEVVDERSVHARVVALSRSVGELARRMASALRSCP